MRVFPSGEEDAGMRVFPSGEEDAGSSSRQPPAAGLVSSGWTCLQTAGHVFHPSSLSCCWWCEREIGPSQYGYAGTDTSSGPEPRGAAA